MTPVDLILKENFHMKKKLISLAVAGALAAPMAAFADGTNVTLFGSVQSEYSTVNIEGIRGGAQADIGDDAARSRFGMHITEQLGGGLKAKAHIEYGLNTGSGDIGFARERWVGLANDHWGEVKLGRVNSPFKDFAGGMTIDRFANTSLQAGGSGGTMVSSANGYGSGAAGFVDNAVRFDSPMVEGFAFTALLMPSDSNKLDPITGNGDPANSGGEDGEWDFQIAGKYNMQYEALDVDLFGGYSRDNVSRDQKALGGINDDEEVWRGGASFGIQDLRISGQYENINNAVGAATCTTAASLGSITDTTNGSGRGQCNSAMNLNGDGEIWFAAAEYTIGNTTLVAQGGISHARKLTGTVAGRDARSFTVGAIHNLSRRSSLFGGYQHVDVDDRTPGVADSDRNTYTVGVRHDF
jgi:general bacterial porin, GBP family